MRQKQLVNSDWVRQKQLVNSDWETISTGGFPPMWKPTKEGEMVEITPLQIHMIPGKGKRKESLTIYCLLHNDAKSFVSGGKPVTVHPGDQISIPVSFNLEGEDKLAIFDEEDSRLAPLSIAAQQNEAHLRVIFDGKVKGGQGSVKRFTILAPKGLREKSLKGEKKAK